MINTNSVNSTRDLEKCTIFHYYKGLLGTSGGVSKVVVKCSGHTRDGTFVIFSCSA